MQKLILEKECLKSNKQEGDFMKKITTYCVVVMLTLLTIGVSLKTTVLMEQGGEIDSLYFERHGSEAPIDDFVVEESFEVNEAHLYLPKLSIFQNEVLEAIIYLDITSDINLIEAEENGFLLLSSNISDKQVSLNIEYENGKTPELSVNIILQSGKNLKVNLFGVVFDDIIFISQYSYEDAEENHLDYLKTANKQHYDELQNIEKGFIDEPPKPEGYESNISKSAKAGRDTYVRGILRWQDDSNNWHPVQYNKVELWDKEPVGERLLATTYTDSSGNYSFTFDNADQWYEFENGGYDVFVRILPAGTNTIVYRGNGSAYNVDSAMYQNIPTGHTEYYSFDFRMNDSNGNPDFFGRAIQIVQAAIVAARYVKTMNESDIAGVSIRYPHNESSAGCFYRRSEKTVYITGAARSNSSVPHSYASWDTIMHEYGHHVQYEFNLSSSPGGTHWINTSMADHYREHFEGGGNPDCTCGRPSNVGDCKLYGSRLAWGEAWPTFIGTAAQFYYASSLSGIVTAADTSYTSYNGVNYDLESAGRLTEDCEVTVQAILFDMMDSATNESHDNLSLSHQTMWNLTTKSKAKTFHEFEEYFLGNHSSPSHFTAFGKILTYNRLAATQPTSSSITDQNPPTFSWIWTERSNYYNNRRFELVFYDSSRNYIGKSGQTSGNSLTISTSLWNTVKSSYGTSFYVSVKMSEINSPITSYESEWRNFSKPIPPDFIRNIYYGEWHKIHRENNCFKT